jgi:hypothetical protein
MNRVNKPFVDIAFKHTVKVQRAGPNRHYLPQILQFFSVM